MIEYVEERTNLKKDGVSLWDSLKIWKNHKQINIINLCIVYFYCIINVLHGGTGMYTKHALR